MSESTVVVSECVKHGLVIPDREGECRICLAESEKDELDQVVYTATETLALVVALNGGVIDIPDREMLPMFWQLDQQMAGEATRIKLIRVPVGQC